MHLDTVFNVIEYTADSKIVVVDETLKKFKRFAKEYNYNETTKKYELSFEVEFLDYLRSNNFKVVFVTSQ